MLLSKIVKTNSILHVDRAIDFVLLKTVLKGYVLFFFFLLKRLENIKLDEHEYPVSVSLNKYFIRNNS